jgi:hypothetical protein
MKSSSIASTRRSSAKTGSSARTFANHRLGCLPLEEELEDLSLGSATNKTARWSSSHGASGENAPMATGRTRELWRHRENEERFIVELEGDRVVAAHGPLTEHEVEEARLAFAHAAHGRTPAYTGEAGELDRRRDEFQRERL